MAEPFDISKVDPTYALGRAAVECARSSRAYTLRAGGFDWTLEPADGCVYATYERGASRLSTYVRTPRMERGAAQAHAEVVALGRRMLACARVGSRRGGHVEPRRWRAPRALTRWMLDSARRTVERALDSGEREEITLQVGWGKLTMGVKECGESLLADWLFARDELELEGSFRLGAAGEAGARELIRRAVESANAALLERGDGEQIELE